MKFKRLFATTSAAIILFSSVQLDAFAAGESYLGGQLSKIGAKYSADRLYSAETLGLDNAYNEYTDENRYNLRGAFSGLGGWPPDVNGVGRHNLEKGPNADVKQNKQIVRTADLQKMAGVFVNEFGESGQLNGPDSAPLGSGKEIIVELQSYGVKREKGDEPGKAAGTGYTLLARNAMSTPLAAALFDTTFKFQDYLAGVNGKQSSYSAGEIARIQTRIDRVLDGFNPRAVYSKPDEELSLNEEGKSSTGLFQVIDSKTSDFQTYFHVPSLVEKLGGTYEKDGSFDKPGKNDYSSYTIYHMTPYPHFLVPKDPIGVTTRNINGVETKGFELPYQAYGYTNRTITGRVGIKGPEVDTMLTASKVAAGNVTVEVQGTSQRVNGKWVPAKNVEYTGNMFISLDQMKKYADDEGNVYLEIDDGYFRKSYGSFKVTPEKEEPKDKVVQAAVCPAYDNVPVEVRALYGETPYFLFNPDPSKAKQTSNGAYYGQVFKGMNGRYDEFKGNGFVPNLTQNGVYHKSTLTVNGKAVSNAEAVDLSIPCVTPEHVGKNGQSFNDKLTMNIPNTVQGSGTSKHVEDTDKNIERITTPDDIKTVFSPKGRYKDLNVNPQFIVDSLSAQYQDKFYTTGNPALSIKYSNLVNKPLTSYLKDSPQFALYEASIGTKPRFIKTDYVAKLSGAKVETKVAIPARKNDLSGHVQSQYYYAEVVGMENGSPIYRYWYKKEFRFEPDESYYKNTKALTTNYTAADMPAISRFYENSDGDLVMQFTAAGWNSASAKADLLFDFEKNKSKLPAALRNLDTPTSPEGGYWRKLVFNGFASKIDAKYKVGGSDPFIFSLGNMDKDGAGLQKVSVADMEVAAGVVKDTANKRLIIRRDTLLKSFKINEQLNLGGTKDGYKSASGLNKYREGKYTQTDVNGYTDLTNALSQMTLYVADQYGRFDWVSLNYVPVATNDGTKSPDFSYYQGNNNDNDPHPFTHKDGNGNDNELTYGHNVALQVDVTRPDTVAVGGGSKPSLLAIWENDNPSIRAAYQYTLSAAGWASKYLPFNFKTSSRSPLYTGGSSYTAPVSADGTARKTGLKLDDNSPSYARFDTSKPASTYQRAKLGAGIGKDYPQVIRAGRGVYYESQITLRAIVEGDSHAANTATFKSLARDIFSSGDYVLTGEHDSNLSVAGGSYRNLNNNTSGNAHGGTSAKFNGSYGTMKFEATKGIESALSGTNSAQATIATFKDAYNTKNIVRSTFTVKIPVRLQQATGVFGGSNAKTKGTAVTGRQFLIHPNTQDGLYTLRAKGKADLSKFGKGFTGNLTFYSAMDPIAVYKSIFDNFEEAAESVQVITNGGKNLGGTGTSTDKKTGETINLPDVGNLLNN